MRSDSRISALNAAVDGAEVDRAHSRGGTAAAVSCASCVARITRRSISPSEGRPCAAAALRPSHPAVVASRGRSQAGAADRAAPALELGLTACPASLAWRARRRAAITMSPRTVPRRVGGGTTGLSASSSPQSRLAVGERQHVGRVVLPAERAVQHAMRAIADERDRHLAAPAPARRAAARRRAGARRARGRRDVHAPRGVGTPGVMLTLTARQTGRSPYAPRRP